MVETGKSVRVIGDVHGHADRLAAAAGDSHQIVLLGDLVDRGPDSAGVLRIALDWIEMGRAQLVRSNHDDKLYRHLKGRKVRISSELSKTLHAIDDAVDSAELKERFVRAYSETPHVRRQGKYVFAHGAVSKYHFAPPDNAFSLTRLRKTIERMALFGQVDGTRDELGRPVRHYDWIEELPADITAVVGHDIRSDTPFVHQGANGARAIFLDTGCGKGGPLSWMDLPDEKVGQIAL